MTNGQAAAQAVKRRSTIERLEVVAAVLLALATVATAWSSYQATRWNGEQAKAAARANGLRIESATAQGRSNTVGTIDVSTFTEWVNARASGQVELTSFYETRFRPEFRPAFDAWIALDPFENTDAPTTPFQMPQYVRADGVQAEALSAEADESVQEALDDIQVASNYILCVVLFAAALFFAGLSTRFASPWPRRLVLIVGTGVFLGSFLWLVTFPVSFAV